jgi:hypothetical protein
MSKKTIVIGEHRVEIPAYPDKSEILFINENDPYWRRDMTLYRDIWFDFILDFTKLDQDATLYNDNDELVSLNSDDSKYIRRIYDQEKRRRREGVFFKNGSEIEYVTGDHYFLMQWARMQRHDGQGSYADYRQFQRDFFLLIKHTKTSEHILGLDISKPKKTGITNLMWSGYYLNNATMTPNKNFGAMSIDQNQAAKTFRDYFMYSYNGLPNPLKPSYKRLSENDGSIIFGNAYSNTKKNRSNNSDGELNTSVFCVPTKEKAFDVAVMDSIWFDEDPKYKTPFGEIWRTNKESVKIQSKINGKAFLTSYTPDEDTQSFRDAREIFFDSELRTITPSSKGQTKSGLICYHIPAYAAWEGAFDKYGKCAEKQALDEIMSERNKVKDNRRNFQAITRQYANDKREAWASAGAGSTFDNVRLGDLLADIEIDQRDSPGNPYREGKLEWVNKKWETGLRTVRKPGQFCDVEFIPITDSQKEAGEEGRYREYFDIPVQHRNMSLKQGFDEYGCLLPPDRFLYVGGSDPTGYAAGSEVIQGSKNASFTFRMPDENADKAMGTIVSKVFVSELYHRAELPIVSYEDILKEIIYTGKLNIIEANASFVATRLMEEGLGHYMLIRDPDGNINRWKPWMGLPTSTEKKLYQLIKISASAGNRDMLETIVRCWKSYIEKPPAGEKDYGKTIKSERTLKQLMDFNPLDTKTSDLVMGGGYALMCYEIYTEILLTHEQDHSENNYWSALSAISLDFE